MAPAWLSPTDRDQVWKALSQGGCIFELGVEQVLKNLQEPPMSRMRVGLKGRDV